MKATLEDQIINTHEIYRLHVGHKFVEGETIYRIISIRGNDALGYIASSEEWFTDIARHMPEFFEVEFQTSVYETAKEALVDAIPSAIQEAQAAGFILDVELSGYEIIANPNSRTATTLTAVEAVTVAAPAPTPRRQAEFGETTFAIGGLNAGDAAEQQTPYPKFGKICKKCGSSASDGAMFTTMVGGNICDDCI